MDNYLVSVVIPTLLERKEYLNRAINSVKKQTHRKIQIIPVYEGNTAGAARNIGIKKSEGEFIAFLDDDDEWFPDKIEKQLSLMLKHPDCSLVTCYSHDRRFGRDRISKPPDEINQKDILNSFNYSSTSTYFVKANLLKSTGGFDESLPSAQEYELAIRLSDKNNPRCVPEILVTQNSTKDQISMDWSKKAKGIRQVYKKHKELFLLSSPLNRPKLYALFVIFYMGHIFGNRIYDIIIPMKERHEKVGVI